MTDKDKNIDGPLGFAILGTGVMARAHAGAINNNPEAKLIKVHGRSVEGVNSMARDFGCCGTVTFEEILNDGSVDAVIVANEPARHVMAVDAAGAGKHLLIEKPLAASAQDAESIMAACTESGVVASVMSQKRFDRALGPVRDALKDGSLGRLLYVDITMSLHRELSYYRSGGGWRNEVEGGVIFNNVIHWIDVAASLFGPVSSVFARLKSVRPELPVEDTAIIILEFSTGMQVVVKASTAFDKTLGERMVVVGEAGSICAEGTRVYTPGAEVPTGAVGTFWNSLLRRKSTVFYPRGSVTDQLSDFIKAVRASGEPLVSLEDGLNALDVVLAAHESNRQGRSVDVSNVVVRAGN